MTIVELLLERANLHPDRTAIIERSGKTCTFSELSDDSAYLAAGLIDKGIKRGDRVLVAVWPSISLYCTLAALWRIGATAVFPEVSMGLKGLRYAAKTISPKAIISNLSVKLIRPFVSELRKIPQFISPSLQSQISFEDILAKSEDAALISFTSGTTGLPKAMERCHDLLLAQHQALASVLLGNGHEVDLVAFPAVALSCLGHGHTIVLPNWNMKRHDHADSDAILRRCKDYNVSRLIAPPVIVENLQRRSQKTETLSLYKIITGGGPLYPDIMRNFKKQFPNLKLTILYGSTEAEPISHLDVENLDDATWQIAFSGGGLPVGQLSEMVSLRIADDGEIQVAGQHVNKSYLDKTRNIESKLAINGRIYHRTGDVGRLDDEGNLWLLGRLGTLEKGLYPFSLEIAARLQPGVDEAAAVSVAGHTILAITGMLPFSNSEFSKKMRDCGVELKRVKFIARDRRHRSKVDYQALKKQLREGKI